MAVGTALRSGVSRFSSVRVAMIPLQREACSLLEVALAPSAPCPRHDGREDGDHGRGPESVQESGVHHRAPAVPGHRAAVDALRAVAASDATGARGVCAIVDIRFIASS